MFYRTLKTKEYHTGTESLTWPVYLGLYSFHGLGGNPTPDVK